MLQICLSVVRPSIFKSPSLSHRALFPLSLSYKHILLSFIPSDDRSSAASGLDVADRLTYLEQRMQMQEDEIQLLKMALADVLKRLNISEEHHAAAGGRRPSGTKCEQRAVCELSMCQLVNVRNADMYKSFHHVDLHRKLKEILNNNHCTLADQLWKSSVSFCAYK